MRGAESNRCVYNCVLGISSAAMCPWQTKEVVHDRENKWGWIGHHSSTTGISINIHQWCCSQPRAVEQWRHVSHCLVCLLVGFRECRALGAPGGKTWICLTLFSPSKIIQAELCVCSGFEHSSQQILHVTSSKPMWTNPVRLS